MTARLPQPTRVYLLMGVSGSGKSTVGKALAETLACPFHDADDFHPEANVAKMAAGEPLTDADREPWLDAIATCVEQYIRDGRQAVLTCSALRRRYRQRLGLPRPGVLLIHLAGSRELLAARLRDRREHFFPPQLLDSQLAALEPPAADEDALEVDIAQPVTAAVQRILQHR